MKAHLEKIGEKKFILTAVVGCFLGDLWLAHYLYQKFSDRTMFNSILELLMQQPQNQGVLLDKNSVDGLYALIVNTLVLFLALMILLHLVNYLFFSKKKNFAFRYLTLLTWIGAPGCILLGFGNLSLPVVGLTFILQGIIYAYVAVGLWNYPWDKN